MKTIFCLFGILGVISQGLAASLPEQGVSSNCQVRTKFAHDVPGSRCSYYDEVMVGVSSIDPLRIRCAQLDVTCRENKQSPEQEEDSGE